MKKRNPMVAIVKSMVTKTTKNKKKYSRKQKHKKEDE